MRAAVFAVAALAVVTALSAWPAPAAARDLGNAVWVSPDGTVATGRWTWSDCTGIITMTFSGSTATGEPVSLSATGKSIMVPNLCTIFCFECPVPFAWTILGGGVDLAGGGVTPAFTLQGAFVGGVLEVHTG